MSPELAALVLTAATIGFFHTLIGPDHYLPFIAISQARAWSRRKTLFVTFLSGLGHVLSSVVLGLAGIGLGIVVSKLEGVESVRGNIASWLLIAFGLVYFLWGLKRALRKRHHSHPHGHPGETHEHAHVRAEAHLHPHGADKANITPWVLFAIFVFGPCEPLIPILMYPAARLNTAAVVLVTAVFSVATIGTMLGIVWLSLLGLKRIPLQALGRFSHATAGVMVLLCGLAIQFLGL